tara:strand:+ start:461 stop:724 length:264 start_codon:yes stop_codon:yes gene_type:complete
MKKDAQQIAMYIAIGALLTVIVLQMMGRLRTERYESDETEAELAALLGELESGDGEGESDDEGGSDDDESAPAPMGGDSDDEMEMEM